MTIEELNLPLSHGIAQEIKRQGGMKKHVAEKCGLTPNTVSAMLNGRKMISPHHAAKIAEVLGVSVDTLFCSKEQQSPIPEGQGSVLNHGSANAKQVVVFDKNDEVLAAVTESEIGVMKFEVTSTIILRCCENSYPMRL